MNSVLAQQDIIFQLTIATYLLSEINSYKSLPSLLNISKLEDGFRKIGNSSKYPDGIWPVNPQFLVYSMHRMMINYPENLLGQEAAEARSDYLAAANKMKIPEPETVRVATWESPYKEDDYRFQLQQVKSEMSTPFQKHIELTQYPIADFELSEDEVYTLLSKLETFCDAVY